MTGPSDDGQAGVTEDLAKARTLVTHADYCSGFGDRGDECICGAAEIAERVAVALAAERAKARARRRGGAAVRPPTGETWPQFIWGVPLSSLKLHSVRWHSWRLGRARKAVERHQAKVLQLREWAVAEQEKLR